MEPHELPSSEPRLEESLSEPVPVELRSLEQALRSGNGLEVMRVIQALNQYLLWRPTRRYPPPPAAIEDESSAHRMMEALSQSRPETWDSFKIYLGDGGMSRVIIAFERGELSWSLSNNSTPEVKERWAKMQGNPEGTQS